jgi:hypothetical protein
VSRTSNNEASGEIIGTGFIGGKLTFLFFLGVLGVSAVDYFVWFYPRLSAVAFLVFITPSAP